MVRTKDYVLRMVSDVALLFSTTVPVNGCWMYELNSTGKIIWENCEKCKDVDELISELEPMFNEPFSSEQKKTIVKYCNTLIELGMLKNEKRM